MTPPDSTFFFTRIDPRAAVKGSRDPLGLQPVWTHFGRKVVGNLTTVTTSLRNFTTLLVGLYFADAAIASGGHEEGERADLFLKFEQLAAYSRYAYHGGDDESPESPRGLRRVKRRLDGGGRVTISAAERHQILSDQKTYGIWGLFSVAARESGLLERNENRLAPAAHEFVEAEYLPRLGAGGRKGASDILRLIGKDSPFEPRGKDRRLGKAIADLLTPRTTPAERDFYSRSLVLGSADDCDHTRGLQQQLWELIVEVNDSRLFKWGAEFGYAELTEVAKRARAGGRAALADALGAVAVVEPVLAASASLFGFLLARGGAEVGSVSGEVLAAWGRGLRHIDPAAVESLRPRVEGATTLENAGRLVGFARLLREGDYPGFTRLATEQNAAVMKARGGAAPWLSVENGRLKVRLREEAGRLAPAEWLRAPWANTYFINSLKSVGRAVYGGRG